eukprot:106574_1
MSSHTATHNTYSYNNTYSNNHNVAMSADIKVCKMTSNVSQIIDNCDYLQSIVKTIKQTGLKHKVLPADKLVQYINNESPKLLDDYTHLVTIHNHQLQYILEDIKTYNKYKIPQCDLKSCSFTIRHRNRRRRTIDDSKAKPTSNDIDEKIKHDDGELSDKEEIFYSYTLDSIHFYVFHLFDTGYRVVIKKNENDIESGECFYYDQEIQLIQQKQIEVVATEDINNDKFTFTSCIKKSERTFMDELCTQMRKGPINQTEMVWVVDEEYDTDAIKIDVDDYFKNSNIMIRNGTLYETIRKYVKDVDAAASSFSTGLIFYYWDHYQKIVDVEEITQDENNINDHSGYHIHELYIKRKYETFEKEIFSWYNNNESRHYITKTVFDNNIYLKAVKWINTDKTRSLTAHQPKHLYYQIKNNIKISKEQLMSVIIYCDFSEICTEFSATFRLMSSEALKSIILRNQEFWWMSRLLRETVQCFGYNRCKEKGPFYCGINQVMVMTQFNIRLCGPTSTTVYKEVASNT